MKTILSKEKYTFKKGQIVHIDQIYGFMKFVVPHAEPYKNKNIRPERFNPDMTDEYKMLKSITVEIVVTENK